MMMRTLGKTFYQSISRAYKFSEAKTEAFSKFFMTPEEI